MTTPFVFFLKQTVNNQRGALWGIILVTVLIVAILVMVLGVSIKQNRVEARRQSEIGQQAPDVNVILYDITPRTIRDRINLPGAVAPWVDLTVAAKVNGEVIEKRADDGDPVREGDVLVRIDSRKYQNAYDSARASLESALASEKRIKSLFQKQLASQSDLDTIQATVKNHRAAMRNAKLDLEHCTIRAPITGIANQVFVEKGQLLATGQEVVRILQIDPVKVAVGIPESDIPAIRDLNRFTVTIDALGGRQFTGEKHFLSKITGTMARLYDLEILIPNPDGAILPGMFARVDIIKQEIRDTIVLPLYAVTSNDNTHSVFVAQDGVVHRREVTMGIQEGFNIQIKNGLETDEQVVVVGQKNVSDGQAVNVIRTVQDPALARQ
ncbi:MAG: efflux RND transporter periplasmic adaptor subunit [Thermodesulfobacteriota bacterium]|nr:efflux RND transporter periplasmic adaptor subunit [Thermodesulfobacteriota bacterium]